MGGPRALVVVPEVCEVTVSRRGWSGRRQYKKYEVTLVILSERMVGHTSRI